MNKVVLMGRLTKEPELRYTANETPVCGFTLAVNRKYRQDNQPEADFVPIVAWQKCAEFCSKYFKKGQKVAVFGRIQTRTWDDDEGKKHWVTEVVAEEVDFADSKKDDSGQDAPPAGQQNKTTGNKPASSGATNTAVGKMPWEV